MNDWQNNGSAVATLPTKLTASAAVRAPIGERGSRAIDESQPCSPRADRSSQPSSSPPANNAQLWNRENTTASEARNGKLGITASAMPNAMRMVRGMGLAGDL